MILGIDASNIRSGGGVTHLVHFLGALNPFDAGFSRVIVYSGLKTLTILPNLSWLIGTHLPILDKSLLHRILWQSLELSSQARSFNCDVLLVPGGSYAGNFRPVVTMSRNMLPFEWREAKRFGRSAMTLKMLLLRQTQSYAFRRADGLIFLTRYAQTEVTRCIKESKARTAIIPHGIDSRFLGPPSQQLPITHYTSDRPFRLLYVSTIDVYKHQWHVAEAVGRLRKSGLPVVLDLVGPANGRALKRLRQTLASVDPSGTFVHYVGPVPHAEIHARYRQADLFIFASSCENMPNILLEAMASGLPIACSNRGPMPEVLGDAGVYFDPEKPSEIATAVYSLIESPALREEKAWLAYKRAQEFTWERCARDTFRFLAEVAANARQGNGG